MIVPLAASQCDCDRLQSPLFRRLRRCACSATRSSSPYSVALGVADSTGCIMRTTPSLRVTQESSPNAAILDFNTYRAAVACCSRSNTLSCLRPILLQSLYLGFLADDSNRGLASHHTYTYVISQGIVVLQVLLDLD